MTGPRVWVDEHDLRLLLEMRIENEHGLITPAIRLAAIRLKQQLDPPPPPPLRPWRACMQGHGA